MLLSVRHGKLLVSATPGTAKKKPYARYVDSCISTPEGCTHRCIGTEVLPLAAERCQCQVQNARCILWRVYAYYIVRWRQATPVYNLMLNGLPAVGYAQWRWLSKELRQHVCVFVFLRCHRTYFEFFRNQEPSCHHSLATSIVC